MSETLQVIVDDLETVAEPLRGFYSEMDDGRFRLNAEGLNGDGDAEKLRRTLAAVKADLAKAKAEGAKYEGIDPEEYARLKTEAEELETTQAEKKGEYDKLLHSQREKLQAKIDEAKKEAEAYRQRLEGHLLETEAMRAIAEADGSPKVLMPHVKARLRAVEEDGRYAVQVLGDDSKPRLRDSDGQPFTASDLLAELRKDPEFQHNFRGRGASGAGTHGSENGGGARTYSRSEFAALSPQKQMEVGQKAAKGEVTITD